MSKLRFIEQLAKKYPKAIRLFMHFYDSMDWETETDRYWSFKDYTEFGFITQVGIMLRFLEKEYDMVVIPVTKKLGLLVVSGESGNDVWNQYKEGIDLCFKAIENAAKAEPPDKSLKVVN